MKLSCAICAFLMILSSQNRGVDTIPVYAGLCFCHVLRYPIAKCLWSLCIMMTDVAFHILPLSCPPCAWWINFFFYLPCSLWLGSLSVCGLAISHDESRHHNLCFLMMMQTYCLDLLPFFFFSNRVIILKQTTIHFGNGQASCTCCLTGKVRIWVHMILDWPWAINAHPFYLKPSVKSDIEYCFPTLADFRCQSHLVFQIVCSEMRYNLAEPLHDHFLFM
jgi:hypothetical protein